MARKQREHKVYLVPVVGESHFQEAVRATCVGDYVDLLIEENPHAKSGRAVRVDNIDGDTVGYVGEDNWLFRAIIEEGMGALAKVKGVTGDPAGIVLEAQLNEEPLPAVAFKGRRQKPPTGCLGGVVAVAALLVGRAAHFI